MVEQIEPQNYKYIVLINKFRNEARDNITQTLQKVYGYGKFWTFPDGIESEGMMPVYDPKVIQWDVNSLVDHIRELNAYPDPTRKIYCTVTVQVIPPGPNGDYDEKKLMEFRY
jgi:hypothetical protein